VEPGAVVALVGQREQPSRGQLAMMPQIRAAVRSCTAPAAGRRPTRSLRRGGDDLQVHAVAAVLAGIERPVGGDHPVSLYCSIYSKAEIDL